MSAPGTEPTYDGKPMPQQHTYGPAPPYTQNAYQDPSTLRQPDQIYTSQPNQQQAAYPSHPQPGYAPDPNYTTPLHRLRDQPERILCPFCNHQAMTRVNKVESSMTYIAGGLLCLVCICLTCLPCMLNWGMHIDHYCTHCGKQVTHQPYDGPVQLVGQDMRAEQHINGAARGPPPPQQQQQLPQEVHQKV